MVSVNIGTIYHGPDRHHHNYDFGRVCLQSADKLQDGGAIMPSFPYMLGWRQDLEKDDPRDYHIDHSEMQKVFKAQPLVNERITGAVEAPNVHSLRKWCSPIEDQGQLGSCTANAAVGMLEYYERKAFGKYIDASRLFLYKVTRTFMHEKGDSGAELRSTMGALALFGAPPEEYWPYDIKVFDDEPPTFCYAFAQNYQSLKYVRLDPAEAQYKDILTQIKTNLSAGLPAMFGFTVYSS